MPIDIHLNTRKYIYLYNVKQKFSWKIFIRKNTNLVKYVLKVRNNVRVRVHIRTLSTREDLQQYNWSSCEEAEREEARWETERQRETSGRERSRARGSARVQKRESERERTTCTGECDVAGCATNIGHTSRARMRERGERWVSEW